MIAILHLLVYMVQICFVLEEWNLSFKTFPQELKIQPDAEFSGISWVPF